MEKNKTDNSESHFEIEKQYNWGNIQQFAICKYSYNDNDIKYALFLYEDKTSKGNIQYIGVIKLFPKETNITSYELPLFNSKENSINSFNLIPPSIHTSSHRNDNNNISILYSTSLCIYHQTVHYVNNIFDISKLDTYGKIDIKLTKYNPHTNLMLILLNSNIVIETQLQENIETKHFKNIYKLFNTTKFSKNTKQQNESIPLFTYDHPDISYSYIQNAYNYNFIYKFTIRNPPYEINDILYIHHYIGIISYRHKRLYLINNTTSKLELIISSIYGQLHIISYEHNFLFISSEDNNIYIIDLLQMELVHILEGHNNIVVDIVCINTNESESSCVNTVRNNAIIYNKEKYDLNWKPCDKVHFTQITFDINVLGNANDIKHNTNDIKKYVPSHNKNNIKTIAITNNVRNYKYTLYSFGKDGKCFQWEITNTKITTHPQTHNDIAYIKLCSTKNVKHKYPLKEIYFNSTNPYLGCMFNHNRLFVLRQREITKTKIGCSIYKVNWSKYKY